MNTSAHWYVSTSAHKMIKLIAKLLLWFGRWDIDDKMKDVMPEKCVMIAVPHTSNWDYPYARAVFYEMGIPLKFTIKDKYTKGLWGVIFRPMGAIGIDRRPKGNTGRKISYTEAMSNIIREYQGQICVIVTPEGTRKRVEEWKTGFYYAAKGAGVPIVLGYMDYTTRKGGARKIIYPSDDMDADMREIMEFYKDFDGKFPELCAMDRRWAPESSEVASS